MTRAEVYQERYCVVVKPIEQMPDITDTWRDTLRPALVAIVYSWSKEELRGTKDSSHGEAQVEVSGERIKDGAPQKHSSSARFAWKDRAGWPTWLAELVEQYRPAWWANT